MIVEREWTSTTGDIVLECFDGGSEITVRELVDYLTGRGFDLDRTIVSPDMNMYGCDRADIDMYLELTIKNR